KLAPQRLTAAERRRATGVTKLAITAAGQAMGDAPAAEVPAVFASSEGDLTTTDALCRTMTAEPPWASPMRFHNAVHNAAVGYWSIAEGVQANTTSVCAWDASFAAGLLEAASQIAADGVAECLLVAYDEPAPEPLYSQRPLANPCAVALRLAAGRGLSLEYAPRPAEAETVMADAALEALRCSNPAARALPLLAALARGEGRARIVCPGGQVVLAVGGR
ncbi:beta-ketoacyl synthase chain length factor, partial [Ectothiorhodospiraceae bacterium WFHF3C12]|nr:beta-ketoacyl synthase chain length factor [Ectothiorhodospiraceae bacterium WFHF3C12]